MYYVEKEGVYGHGVFGIYIDLKDAIEQAKHAALMDCDDWHYWIVKEYAKPDKHTNYASDSENKIVFSCDNGIVVSEMENEI